MKPSSTQTSFASFVFGALFVLTMIAVSTGCQPLPTPVTGQQIYTRYCAQCHQAEGSGIERAFPPIRGTEWVNGDQGRLIRLVLYGMQGPIEVQGQTYNNAMAPHGFLTDEQVAAVLTFVRSSFENDADPVLPDEVARVRAAEGERGLFLASDLQNRLGVPDMDSTAVVP